MKRVLSKVFAVAVVALVTAMPSSSAQAWPWGFNCCGMSVGQSWGYGWGGGPWGYYPPYWGPWGYPYYPYYGVPYYGWGVPYVIPAPATTTSKPSTSEAK